MKNTSILLAMAVVLFACQPQEKAEDPNAAAKAVFERNAEVVMADMNNWVNETPDYSLYAENAYHLNTHFGAEKDSISVEEGKASDQQNLALFDFKIIGEMSMLPGVNAQTKEMDGSVRTYLMWEVTRPATDSTSEKSGMLPVYHTFEFNEEGKIIRTAGYGDFSGLMGHLLGSGGEAEEMSEEGA
jgi:hypothetical protein